MHTKDQLIILFAYHWHTLHHLMERAAQLSSQDYRENPGYGHGSLHDLFFHLLRSDRNWRLSLESGRQPESLRIEDFPDLASLQAAFLNEKSAWQALLGALGEGDLPGELSLTNRRGETRTFLRWRILQHVVLHGMQHCAEIAERLTAKGQSPGNIDFIFFDG